MIGIYHGTQKDCTLVDKLRCVYRYVLIVCAVLFYVLNKDVIINIKSFALYLVGTVYRDIAQLHD